MAFWLLCEGYHVDPLYLGYFPENPASQPVLYVLYHLVHYFFHCWFVSRSPIKPKFCSLNVNG